MENNPSQESKLGFIKTLLAALICAGIIRSFLFEPFHIPSGSMKPGLLIGDYIFVSKYSYGYSRYSFPFGFNIFEGRIFNKAPQRGDVAVFRLPSNPSINYIKRVIGLPGDRLQMISGVLYINGKKIEKISDGNFYDANKEIAQFLEKLPEGKLVKTLDSEQNSIADNTGIFEVPQGHYFMMGDNRDNSQDSRFLSHVGYVAEENLVGKAQIIFFSNEMPTWQFWYWPYSIRFSRILQKIS